jgi:wyosine [tRNA(Phe)-imidazoG37] synthetase (radical SAM superfamily)
MKYVFGPVPSRRLGRSLGIDPIPMKTCNWNCVYCQLGRSTPLVNDRSDYAPVDDMLAEFELTLAKHKPGDIDWVSIVGSGEPLLHVHIGDLVTRIKNKTDLPVAMFTNGSLLSNPDVRTAILGVDAVLPTIDAGSPEMFKKVNRPHPGISFEAYVEGLVAFRKEYDGKFWPEVMLMKDLNDTEEALRDIAGILRRLSPDLVHINLPSRPPAETWIEPPSEDSLLRALAILGNTANVVHPAAVDLDLAGFDSVVDAVVDIVSRHPTREDEIKQALAKWSENQVEDALAELTRTGRVKIVERYGVRFLTSMASSCPSDGGRKDSQG